jgi:hypothetical protein
MTRMMIDRSVDWSSFEDCRRAGSAVFFACMGLGRQQVVDAMHFDWLALISFQTYNGVSSSGSDGLRRHLSIHPSVYNTYLYYSYVHEDRDGVIRVKCPILVFPC